MMFCSLGLSLSPSTDLASIRHRRSLTQHKLGTLASRKDCAVPRYRPLTAYDRSSDACDPDACICKWTVQIVQEWDAVTSLVKVLAGLSNIIACAFDNVQ